MLRRASINYVLPSVAFRRFVEVGTLRDDHRQQEALIHVDRLYNDLEAYTRAPKPRDLTVPAPVRKGYTNVSYIKTEAAKQFLKDEGLMDKVHPLTKMTGLYLFGGVGCGKTQLMDILYHEAPVPRKKRVHFHQFMLDVHKLQHKIRQSHTTGSVDGQMIMTETAVKLCHDAELLCFDELVVADIVDAMILKRLFTAMYALGVCCIFTSNRPPEDLYLNGLNRESFLPFIRMIHEKCVVHDMQSDTDYRLTGRQAQVYFAGMTDENFRDFNKLFLDLTNQRIAKERVLRVFGRDVVAPRTVGGVAYFTYQELCVEDRSAADFGVIAKVFHTIFIEGLPRFGPQDSDGRRRFITLIDELYQARVKVIVLAEDQLELLGASDEHLGGLISETHPDIDLLSGGGGGGDGQQQQLSQIDAKAIMQSKQETFYAGQLIGVDEDDF